MVTSSRQPHCVKSSSYITQQQFIKMDLYQLQLEANLSDLQIYAQGLEFNVYTAQSPLHGKVVVRVPKQAVFQNANDPDTDALALIQQELRVYNLLENSHVPVPHAIGHYVINGYPAMVSQFVDSDDSSASSTDMGHMLAAIHSVDVPEGFGNDFVAMDGNDAITTIVKRMVYRFGQFAELSPETQPWIPTEETLQSIGETLKAPPSCLLHMDFRDVNLRMQGGKIAAVIDWTNALIGPAAVDFFRTLEWSELDDTFFTGYAKEKAWPQVSATQEAFLRLDAALTLALVFMSEAPDPERIPGCIKRVRELVQSLS